MEGLYSVFEVLGGGCGGSYGVFILLDYSQRFRRQGEVNLLNGYFLGTDIEFWGQGIGDDQNWRGLRGRDFFCWNDCWFMTVVCLWSD